MARDHARFQTSVHRVDGDWRRLDWAAQHTYWMLLSHPDLSYAGVIDYLPGRWVELATGLTEAKLKANVRALERAKYVVVDRKTHELLVRTFIRHDKVLARKNMGIACGRALGNVHSQALRDAVMHELARLWIESPALEGWSGFKEFDPEAFAMACAMASDMERAMA